MYKTIFKRVLDLISAVVIIVICLFPMLAIAILIKIDSKGSLFYRQERIGKDGDPFWIFKFRTMVPKADQIGSFKTEINDSRVTNIGKILRKLSLDELPQVFNILLSEMSLIGPRPDVPAQKINYTAAEFIERHLLYPGITGLAQCRGRHNLNNRNRVRYDVFYNNNVSLILDIKIILWTFKTLKKGSY
jgi:lipopolysaccharide/colanic/teichoic acid biosynthesis glycosyltransferase